MEPARSGCACAAGKYAESSAPGGGGEATVCSGLPIFSCHDLEIANPAAKMDEYRLDRKKNSTATPR
jgi:hypothetical protein